MRRLSGLILAGALIMAPALFQGHGTTLAQGDEITFTGDMVLWAFEVRANRTADYEKVIATLRDSLSKSSRPEAKRQLAGWKIMRSATPQPSGGIVYIHVINPVIRGADYSITNIVYEVVTTPRQQQAFYDLYSGALSQPLFSIQGPVTADFSR